MNAPFQTYSASWRAYRRWYYTSLALFVGYLPLFGTFAAILSSLRAADWVIFVAFAIYASTWVAASNVARRWPCPRCGEYFFGTLWLPTLPMFLIRTCRYCDFPKYLDPDSPRGTSAA